MKARHRSGKPHSSDWRSFDAKRLWSSTGTHFSLPNCNIALDAAEVSSFVSSVNGSSSCFTFWIFGIDIDVSWWVIESVWLSFFCLEITVARNPCFYLFHRIITNKTRFINLSNPSVVKHNTQNNALLSRLHHWRNFLFWYLSGHWFSGLVKIWKLVFSVSRNALSRKVFVQWLSFYLFTTWLVGLTPAISKNQ